MKDSIQIEPKRPNRFIVELIGTNLESWAINKISRPVYTIDKGWEDITIEILDPIGPSSSRAIYDGIIGKGLRNRELKIKLLESTGAEIEVWKIGGDYNNIDFGKLDYSVDDILNIKIVFNIKSCMLE